MTDRDRSRAAHQLTAVPSACQTIFFDPAISSTTTGRLVQLIQAAQGGAIPEHLKESIADTVDLINQLSQNDKVAGSKQYLERQFYRLLTKTVKEHIRDANRGPEIGIIPTIQAFVNAQKLGDNAWAVLYYALRSGASKEGYEFADSRRDFFDGDVLYALQARASATPLSGQRLTRDLTTEATRRDVDPFRALVLFVLSGAGPLPPTGGETKVEDWLWLRLQMGGDMKEIAREVQRIGALDETKNPFIVGQVKLVCHEFREAILWFQTTARNVYVNFHLGFWAARVLMKTEGFPAIQAYAVALTAVDQGQALRYIVNTNGDGSRADAIAHLAVDGVRGHRIFRAMKENPAIAQVVQDEERRQCLELACELAEERDEYRKAAKLYMLATAWEKVVEVTCRGLRQTIDGFRGYEVVKSARSLFDKIESHASVMPAESWEAFKTMITFAFAAVLNRNKKFFEALQQIDQLNFFPGARKDRSSHREKLQRIQPLLAPVLPDIFLITLRALAGAYKTLTPEADPARQSLKEKSACIIALTGVVDLPQDVQRTLLDLDNEIR
jgi:hypothetical protein